MLSHNMIQYEAVSTMGSDYFLIVVILLLFQHMGLGNHLEAHLEMIMTESGLNSVPHLDLAHARRCPYTHIG